MSRIRSEFLSALVVVAGVAALSPACSHAGAEAPGAASPAPDPSPPPSTAVDPYHPAPRDTVDAETYEGWKQFSLHCSRCHGDEALGTSFAPDLVASLAPGGNIGSRDDFMAVVSLGRHDKGMPSAATLGLDSVYFGGLYLYLKGRSEGRFHGGRPARRSP
jgi:mono/diheme cytochrome c family protein